MRESIGAFDHSGKFSGLDPDCVHEVAQDMTLHCSSTNKEQLLTKQLQWSSKNIVTTILKYI